MHQMEMQHCTLYNIQYHSILYHAIQYHAITCRGGGCSKEQKLYIHLSAPTANLKPSQDQQRTSKPSLNLKILSRPKANLKTKLLKPCKLQTLRSVQLFKTNCVFFIFPIFPARKRGLHPERRHTGEIFFNVKMSPETRWKTYEHMKCQEKLFGKH